MNIYEMVLKYPIKVIKWENNFTIEFLNKIASLMPAFAGAIKEEYRDIRREDILLPIEKVERINDKSIRYLASHSEYFDQQNKLPKKLLVSENNLDSVTYENCFIYAVLIKLKDILSNLLEENIDSYYELQIIKQDEVIYQIKNLIKYYDNDYQKIIIKLLKEVNYYLALPLMVEVGKYYRHNQNFILTNILKYHKAFQEIYLLNSMIEKVKVFAIAKEYIITDDKLKIKLIHNIIS